MTTTFDTPCQVLAHQYGRSHCGAPSVYRYEAMGGGFMYCCGPHGRRHARISERADGVIGDIYADVIRERDDPTRVRGSRGLSYRNPEAAAHLRAFGLTDEQTAEQFGCALQTARHLRGGYAWTPAKVARLEALLSELRSAAPRHRAG